MPSATGSSPAEGRPRRRPSLVRRLTRLSVAVMGAALLLSSLALSAWVYHSLREAQLKSAEQSAQLLAENLAPALAFHDRGATRDALVAFSRREGLQSLIVRRPDGELFAHWPDAAASLPWSDAGREVGWQGLRLVEPVQLQGERIGSLAWQESFDALNETLLRLALGAVLVLAAAMLGASLLLRWTQRRAHHGHAQPREPPDQRGPPARAAFSWRRARCGWHRPSAPSCCSGPASPARGRGRR